MKPPATQRRSASHASCDKTAAPGAGVRHPPRDRSRSARGPTPVRPLPPDDPDCNAPELHDRRGRPRTAHATAALTGRNAARPFEPGITPMCCEAATWSACPPAPSRPCPALCRKTCGKSTCRTCRFYAGACVTTKLVAPGASRRGDVRQPNLSIAHFDARECAQKSYRHAW